MPGRADIVPGVDRLAVLKAGGLGDVLFSLPALEALRAAYPGAEILLLTSPIASELLRDRPGPCDRVATVPPFEGDVARTRGGAGRLEAFCSEMRSERLDLVLQMHGGGANSNPLVLRFAARHTAGLRDAGAPPLGSSVAYRYFQSEVLRCLEVAALAGARPVTVEPRVALTPADVAAADDALPASRRPLAVIHPGAGDLRRRWPPARFAEVGRALTREGAGVTVIGTAAERRVTAEVAAAVPGSADVCGLLSLPALCGLLARASLLVSNDSGPLHLARALGTATAGVYWGGNLVNAGPVAAAHNPVFASWRTDCPVCGADCMAEGCSHDATFVAGVDAAEVSAAAVGLLLAGGHATPAASAEHQL